MTLDIVATFTELQNLLQTGNSSFRNGMHCYFWGRLASVVVSIRAIDQEEDDKFKNSLFALLQQEKGIDLQRVASEAEHRAKSLSAGRSNSLLIVSYWSNICYAFHHIESQDPKWSVYSADSFLGAIEDFSDEHGAEKLSVEMENLSRGILAARAVVEEGETQQAQSIIRWASSGNLGALLTEYSPAHR